MAQPALTSIAAHLYVTNIAVSLSFFERLGFTADFVYGEPAFYAQVSRDQALFALRHVDEPVFRENVREREDLLSASITLATVDGIKQLFQGWRDAGILFHQALRDEPWGAKTFVIPDPDGNLILFAGPSR